MKELKHLSPYVCPAISVIQLTAHGILCMSANTDNFIVDEDVIEF